MTTARDDAPSLGTDRAVFVDRIRVAVGRGGPGVAAAPPDPPEVDERLMRRADARAPLADLFAGQALEAGVSVHRVNSATGIVYTLEGLFARLGLRKLSISVGDASLLAAIQPAIGPMSIVDWRRGPGLSAHYDADAGITDVAVAIAETGTLVMRSGAVHSRGVFVVPPVHIALVSADRIIPDLLDLWPAEGADEPPAATVLVTGPSKTADIEGILVTGVHGPREVHVILIEA